MEAGTKEKQENQEQEQEERSQNGDREQNVGTIEEVQGVVVEAVFPDKIPDINHALELDMESDGDEKRRLVLEVQQHLGDERVRAVAMDSTDGLSRGTEVRDTGGPITGPVG